MESPPNRLFDDRPLPVGEHVRLLLAERGWTQDDLATVLGYSRSQVNELIAGRSGITLEMAIALGKAFSTTADYWILVDAKHRLAQMPESADDVGKRASLFDMAPIKDMQKRGWIKPVKSLADIEVELRRFFGVSTLDTAPEFPVATRKSAPLSDLSAAQRAWCFRVRQLAISPPAKPYDPTRLDRALSQLRRLAAYPTQASRVAEVLSEVGIRFAVVEPIAGAKVDGCAFWLDPESPAIGMSLRYDRNDYFWFTLMHEMMHVVHRDALSIDTDLAANERPPALMKDEIERRADEGAAAALVPADELESFMRRVGPLYSKPRIVQFAHRIKMHPGIIVGQLQNRGEIGYRSNREMLSKVRSYVIETSITDGWKNTISPDTDDEAGGHQ